MYRHVQAFSLPRLRRLHVLRENCPVLWLRMDQMCMHLQSLAKEKKRCLNFSCNHALRMSNPSRIFSLFFFLPLAIFPNSFSDRNSVPASFSLSCTFFIAFLPVFSSLSCLPCSRHKVLRVATKRCIRGCEDSPMEQVLYRSYIFVWASLVEVSRGAERHERGKTSFGKESHCLCFLRLVRVSSMIHVTREYTTLKKKKMWKKIGEFGECRKFIVGSKRCWQLGKNYVQIWAAFTIGFCLKN